jgi:hypothetical protein
MKETIQWQGREIFKKMEQQNQHLQELLRKQCQITQALGEELHRVQIELKELKVARSPEVGSKRSTEPSNARPLLSRQLTPSTPARAEVARKLANNGFNVEQLITFFDNYYNKMKMNDVKRITYLTTTKDLVKNIVIPETSDPPRSYMQSKFMVDLGGAKPAKKLVSHAWDSPFSNMVLNILLDASGWSKEEVLEKSGFNKDQFKFEELKASLSEDALQSTYWMCLWAVNEHLSICGDCFDCRTKASTAWSKEDFKSPTCKVCGTEKRNPCPCGSAKTPPTDDQYEIDKFDLVVAEMDALVVSLDKSLQTIDRIWVQSEIGRALGQRTKPVRFRNVHRFDDEKIDLLRKGEALMLSVKSAKYSSYLDKEEILKQIQKYQTTEEYDQF